MTPAVHAVVSLSLGDAPGVSLVLRQTEPANQMKDAVHKDPPKLVR